MVAEGGREREREKARGREKEEDGRDKELPIHRYASSLHGQLQLHGHHGHVLFCSMLNIYARRTDRAEFRPRNDENSTFRN